MRQMIGLGVEEIAVVLVVALVMLGPKHLPTLAGQLGRWMRDRSPRERRPCSRQENQAVPAGITGVKPRLGRQLRAIFTWDALMEWARVVPAVLALVGIVIALITHDYRLASRSAMVLFASLVLRTFTDVRGKPPH
jgi:hypothetical protein